MSAVAPAGARPRRQIRVAVVGLGWAAQQIWLPRLQQHPAFEVTAVVDPDPSARAAVAGRAGRRLAAPAELDAGLADLAVVAVPNHLHSSVAGQLLARGLTVFVEKPVCLTSREADELIAAERAAGATLLAGSAARYRADVRALGELVSELGRIRHVEVSWVRARGVPDAGGWFTQRRLAGGGALLDLGWHLLDTLAPMIGLARFGQVTGTVTDDFLRDGSAAAAWRAGRGARSPAEGRCDVEDTARGFLLTADGISVSLHASWASHEPCDATQIRVYGSAATAALACTFGFSPNRRGGSVLTRTRKGATELVPVPDEAIGQEYLHQLDMLPGLLADPASQGRAATEARWIIGAIESIYASAVRPGPAAGRPLAAASGARAGQGGS